MKKVKLLNRLLDEGWFGDEKEAGIWILLRRVLVADVPATSCAQLVLPEAPIRVREYYKRRYCNRGGLKLEGAISTFGADVAGLVALDCGASTGGFTDCLLQHGAAKVYAVDAGHGQLAGKLASDERVVNMENTNLGDAALLSLDPGVSVVTLDLSYLSLKQALPICKDILGGTGTVIALVKPVYEIGGNGVVDDPLILRGVLSGLVDFSLSAGYGVAGVCRSPITGSGGAIEFFLLLTLGESKYIPLADSAAEIFKIV